MNSKLNLFSVEYFPSHATMGVSIFEVDNLEDVKALFTVSCQDGELHLELFFKEIF